MKNLSIDLETFSDISISDGVYKYASSENFEILLFGYSIDYGPVNVIDLASGDTIPDFILEAITNPNVTKWAYNANFERICLSAYMRKVCPDSFKSYIDAKSQQTQYLDPVGWRCSMVWCSYLGLALSLAMAGEVLGLDKQKLTAGKDLIRYFCLPCKPTKVNGQRTRNYYYHDPEKWDLFKSYNKRDVEVELEIHEKLERHPVPDMVWKEYWQDQRINDNGISVDVELVENALVIDRLSKQELMEELGAITHLENPNSVIQMKSWLLEQGIEVDTLGKKAVKELIGTTTGDVKKALQLRLDLAKSSNKKYTAIENAVLRSGRISGMFQFMGAPRTHRWAGRQVQLQNLPQNHLSDLDGARGLIRDGNFEALDCLYDSVPQVLSECIRTVFIPAAGMKFCVADYSAIEARCMSYMAKEDWRIQAFANNEDIYCSSASIMFGIPVEKHGQNKEYRKYGKIAELALGYGGSCGALKAMGALDMGIAEEELQPLVDNWRSKNPHIVQFWWDVDRAAKESVVNHTRIVTHGLVFCCDGNMLTIRIPSGKKLHYIKPEIGINKFGGDCITYMGLGPTRKWERLETYGPKLCENVIQATCRDILANALENLKDYSICAHVHDEVIIECPMETSLDEICEKMSQSPSWMSGLLLKADGFETQYYKKD